MISLNQAKKLSHLFVKEACLFLKTDYESIRIIYSTYIEPYMGIPQFTKILEDDTIVIGEDFLLKCAKEGCTPLRGEMYAKVRYITRRREFGEKNNRDILYFDAYAYSMALMFLKGLQPICSNDINPELYFASTIKILHKEFGLKVNLFQTPTEPFNGHYFYKLHLDKEEEFKLYKYYYLRKVPFSSKCPLEGEKGSLENPFENVYDAVEYLKQVEHEAFNEDRLIQDISDMKYYYDYEQRSFRIIWASPHVAHMKNSFPTKSFIMSQMKPLDSARPDIFYFSLKPNLYKHKFLYRGQCDHYEGKPCVPNLFRNPKHNEENDYLDYLIFSQEMEILIQSHPIVQLLEQGIELLHDTFRIRMNYTGLAQHYYNKSNFLDLTSDIEVMKFFATTTYDDKNDKYNPYKGSDMTGVIYYYEMRFPEAFQAHAGYELKTIGKQVFMRSGAQSGFLLQMEKGVDFKKLPEVKAIYFKHDPDIAQKIYEESKQGEIYFAEDLLQHAWKDRLKERFNKRIVSYKAVELNVSRNSNETIDSIKAKLKAKNISVDDFIPEFTKEELDDFYKDIDKWWNDFCDDIHFMDTEDELYRQALKEIRYKKEYSWAFEPSKAEKG